MTAHISIEVIVILTFRITTFLASTLIVHPSITTFSITCPEVLAVIHPDFANVTPAWTPVFVASG
jgi:hypothetical protein